MTSMTSGKDLLRQKGNVQGSENLFRFVRETEFIQGTLFIWNLNC